MPSLRPEQVQRQRGLGADISRYSERSLLALARGVSLDAARVDLIVFREASILLAGGVKRPKQRRKAFGLLTESLWACWRSHPDKRKA